MANLRFMGSSGFEMVKVKDDGKFDKVVRVRPRDEVEVSDEAAERWLQGPRYLRVWVEVGSVEDPESNDYVPSRFDAVTGNATPYPELDMGSTVVSNRTITRTEDDNEEGFELAATTEGPASDNAALIEEEEARIAGEKAAADVRNKATQKSSSSSTSTQKASPQATSSSDNK